MSAEDRGRRARYLFAMEHDRDDERHGTAYGYSLGCRCARCCRAEQERRMADEPKGGASKAHDAACAMRLKRLEQSAKPRKVTIHQVGEVRI